MTYEETIHYLYTSVPVFQHSGASAYKPGLETSLALDNLLEHPHKAYRTIHVAGTNGKGSVSHLLAAILQEAGYKVGLYTSPHLVDFRERIRVNGKKISEDYVVRFVEQYKTAFEPLHPSFFELTSTMAFAYFREKAVDFAVIETGLGGRLDSTNIIHPILSVITNISMDHTQFLGDTLEKIAGEKAGIIKAHTPVVIGDVTETSVMEVFLRKAAEMEAPLVSSVVADPIKQAHLGEEGHWHFKTRRYGEICGELGGVVQAHNAATVLTAVGELEKTGIRISDEAIREAFAHVVERTGLMGRWQTLQNRPRVICDTGHNTGGWQYLAHQLEGESRHCPTLRMIVGMVNDKDIDGVLSLMPAKAVYYFTQASIARALPAETFAAKARKHGLQGTVWPTVGKALEQALADASPDDLIFIGGSTFVVADALSGHTFPQKHNL